MGNKQNMDKQTTGNMPRESSQTGTQGQGTWNKGDQSTTPGGWNDRSQREMQQGDQTKPAYPSGTSPLDKDEQPVNKTRPVQQNR